MNHSSFTKPFVCLAPSEPVPRTKSETRLRAVDAPDFPVVREYLLPSDYTLVSYHVGQLVSPRADDLGPQELDELRLALRELLLNAIEHGNLSFGYHEKTRCLEDGTWKKRVAERQRQPEFVNRAVAVSVSWERDRVVIVIRDEGAGFDWRNLPDPTDPDNLLVAHGRGVLMAQLSVDSLQFNEAGNEVTIVKLLSGIPDSQRVAG